MYQSLSLLLKTFHGTKRISCKIQRKINRCVQLCKMQMIFYDFEDDLEKNMFDELFLKDYNEKLYHHLMELLNTNKCAVCSFLDNE